ncbi:MAG: hypothetical protein MUQ00_11505 [Candidatus Aminicenantes bacterium]|nr:hypothetical protein [Candidatus Aminicenantes bacterium]
MDKWHGGRELARFSKNSSEDVRLTLHNWGVGRYLDIRVWSKIRPTDDLPSNRTEHGLVLGVDLLLDLKWAIDQAIVELLEATERAKGTVGQFKGKDSSGSPILLPPEKSDTPTLAELGLTKNESSRAQAALGGDVEGHRDARSRDLEGVGPGLDKDESGVSQGEGEKKLREKPAEARTPAGDSRGQGQSRP